MICGVLVNIFMSVPTSAVEIEEGVVRGSVPSPDYKHFGPDKIFFPNYVIQLEKLVQLNDVGA